MNVLQKLREISFTQNFFFYFQASHESSYDELVTELNAEKAKVTTITKENQTNLETLTEMKEKCAKMAELQKQKDNTRII